MSLLKFSKDSTLLVEKSLPKHPITLFNDWLDHAKKNLPSYQLPTAMCLSTFNENNVSNRSVDVGGFVFFTNLHSPKARDMESNPKVACCFHWCTEDSTRTVRIVGSVQRLSAVDDEASWRLVPRPNQIRVVASPMQSFSFPSEVDGRVELDKVQQQIEDEVKDMEHIPKPDCWGGYRIVPHHMEFWHGRQHIAHDRIEYTQTTTSGGDIVWEINRLVP